jgi:hypothetical protein
MNVRYAEGWLAALLSAQPWVSQVSRWTLDGGPKPVGLTLNGSVRIQLVRGAPTATAGASSLDDWDGSAVDVPQVAVSPASPQQWADAIVKAAAGVGHPLLTSAETFADWGMSRKPAGVRLVFTDGAAVYGSLLDVR